MGGNQWFKYLETTWEYNIPNNGIIQRKDMNCRRTQFAIAYDEYRRKIFVFGGRVEYCN